MHAFFVLNISYFEAILHSSLRTILHTVLIYPYLHFLPLAAMYMDQA